MLSCSIQHRYSVSLVKLCCLLTLEMLYFLNMRLRSAWDPFGDPFGDPFWDAFGIPLDAFEVRFGVRL